jgi:oxygen-independent coproporphyrinogen-3 oxidase
MKLVKQEAPLTEYAQTLKQELNLLARSLPGRMKISHLHWGGGTPTALKPDDLETIMQVVREKFDVSPNAELAIESDPRTLTSDMITRIGSIGFTRASFGVQEFDDTVQKAINRVQPPEMVRQSVEGLRGAGVDGINFDLIYGLPHQTVDTLLNTIRLCVKMRPNRIALFGYAHVPWMAKKQRLIDEAALPGPSDRLKQAQAAAQALVTAGYVAIGLDHFALPDDDMAKALETKTLRRNFQGYTTDPAETMLGVGSTSIGRTPFGYMQNISETGAWRRSVEAGELPVGKGVAITQADKLRGYVIEQLMCSGGVDLEQAADQFETPRNWYHSHVDKLRTLQDDGLLTLNQGQISVTLIGTPFIRIIAAVFDAYLSQSPAKHAIAV